MEDDLSLSALLLLTGHAKQQMTEDLGKRLRGCGDSPLFSKKKVERLVVRGAQPMKDGLI